MIITQRELKFRYIVKHVYSGNVETKIYTLHQIEERPLKSLSPVFVADYEILGKSQFTGLHDKNGKEIYEGDILDTHAQFENNTYIRKVIYKDCGLSLAPGTGYTLCKGNEKHFEVIGNIYETPELEVSYD